MNTQTLSLITIIPNLAKHANCLAVGSFAGIASDFDMFIAMSLLVVGAILWAANYFTLRTHLLTRQQLRANRIYEIFVQKKLTKRFVISPRMRDVFDFLTKIFSIVLLYYFASSKNRISVWLAGSISIGFILLNVRTVLREILHPRSTFNRRYLLFEKNPRFIRIRSMFELVRRTLYFVTGFAFVSYTIHRLYPGTFIADQGVPLFLAHFESALSMVCFANDPIKAVSKIGIVFHIMRGICFLSVVILFANLLVSSFSLSDFKSRKRKKPIINSNIITTGIEKKEDLLELTLTIVQSCFEGASKKITPDCDLAAQLHADNMEIAELQTALEEAFECKLPTEEFNTKRTVREIIDLLWQHLQRQKTEPMFPSIANHFQEPPQNTSSSKPDKHLDL